jgi:enoyl-CoA hydratase
MLGNGTVMTLSDSELVSLEKEDGLAWIRLRNVNKMNAITQQMWSTIHSCLSDISDDPEVLALIITGTKNVFSAGGDISEFDRVFGSDISRRSHDRVTEGARDALAQFPKPTVAMIQGPCVGAGLAIAVACDFRFCDTTAEFAVTPAKMGLVLSLHETRPLVEMLGPVRARNLLLSGRIVGPKEAHQIGLVDSVFEPKTILQSTIEFVKEIGNSAQFAVRGAKRVVGLIVDGHVSDNEETQGLRRHAFDSDDFQEGRQAFLEKRPPRFSYR